MTDEVLRAALADYLSKEHTHASFASAIKDFPESHINQKPESGPYTFWELLYHISFTQHDMVDFSVNRNYKDVEWPKDYWPDKSKPASKQMWDEQVRQFEDDMKTLEKVVADAELFKKIEWGTGQTVFKEYLQIIDHAAYHIGEFVLMRKIMGIWKK